VCVCVYVKWGYWYDYTQTCGNTSTVDIPVDLHTQPWISPIDLDSQHIISNTKHARMGNTAAKGTSKVR